MTDQIAGLEMHKGLEINNELFGVAFSNPAICSISIIFQVLHFLSVDILWSVVFWSCKFNVLVSTAFFPVKGIRKIPA